MTNYSVPVSTVRCSLEIKGSRFITTVCHAPTVDEARDFIQQIREEMPDASHHVYAFVVGFGENVVEGMSDAGEPSGTAGRPSLMVLRGSQIGDVALVTTRYFGGSKLGTGGLVRAYTEAAQSAILQVPTQELIEKQALHCGFHYRYLTQIRRLLVFHDADVVSEQFTEGVNLIVDVPTQSLKELTAALTDLTSGQIVLERVN